MKNEINDEVMTCSKLLINWGLMENKSHDHLYDMDEELMHCVSIVAVMNKIHMSGIDIKVPTPLYLMLMWCSQDNPGQAILLFKTLLESIKRRLGYKIPRGYEITVMDFSMAFPNEFPLMSNQKINDEYYQKWQAQKQERKGLHITDNQCDYPPYWLEVCEGGTANG